MLITNERLAEEVQCRGITRLATVLSLSLI